MLRKPEYVEADFVRSDAWSRAADGIWDVREIWKRDKTQVFTDARHGRIAYALLLIHNELPDWVMDEQGKLPSLDNQDGDWLWSKDENNPSEEALRLMYVAKHSAAIAATLDALIHIQDAGVILTHLQSRLGIRS